MKKKCEKLCSFLMLLIHKCLIFLGKKINYELTDSTWHILEQFIKFSCVGCLNAVITLLVYYSVIIVNKDWYLFGNLLGYALGIVNSYWFNHKFVFKNIGSNARLAFLKMFFCYGITYVLQLGLLYFFVEHLLISKALAPILTIIIITPINFALNKLWAFKN